MKKQSILLSLFLFTCLQVYSQSGQPKGLMVNDKAPDFSAKDQSGKEISLGNELKKNKVLLVFYRGEWCPYCNKELKALEDSIQLIKAKGVAVIAVSPERAENISKTIAKTKASYSILHDEGLAIMKRYDVSFTVDSLTVTKYKAAGIDFNAANGSGNGTNLPVPAIYIIGKDQKITYRYFNADYRRRPTVKELLSKL